MIRVKRKAHKRKAYTRKDGTRVKSANVKAATYMMEDRGKPGRTPEKEKWFKPQEHTGWEKDQSVDYRRRKVYKATDGRKSRHDRYVEAGRKMQSLANVTTDSETKRKAQADASYFFEMARKHK